MNAAAGSETVAVLRYARRVWAIGPTHGMRDKLVALHAVLWDRFEAGDRLVYLGNYMGLGPDVVGTIDELVSFRTATLCRAGMEPEDIVFLRGAQEEMWRKLLQIQFAPAPLDVFEWMMSRGVDATLAAYGGERTEGAGRCRGGPLAITRWTSGLRDAMRRHPGHEDVMISLRQAAMTEGRELLFAHAGVDPTRPLEAQGDVFWWGSSRFAELSEPFDGFRLVVAGFRADHPGVVVAPHSALLDGGCGYGGSLAAACFDLDGRMVDRIDV
jgi:serine/threonine protein phosphatase 1